MHSSSTPTREAAARPRRIARVLATIVFLGLLATPLAVRYSSSASQTSGPALSAAAVLERYGFVLEDVSQTTGIQFTHQTPALDSKLQPIMPAVAAYGAAVSVVDFDRDGWQDLYVTTSAVGGQNALYRNVGDGTFEDRAGQLGVGDVNRPATGVSNQDAGVSQCGNSLFGRATSMAS